MGAGREICARHRQERLIALLVFIHLAGWSPVAFGTEVGPIRLGFQSAQHSATAGGNSSAPFFSRDGHAVVFLSEAHNLVTNDDRTLNLNVFVRDLVSRSTTLVSVDTSGLQGADAACFEPSASSNGQIIAFTSKASNLGANNPALHSEVYVRDLGAGITTAVRSNVMGGVSGYFGSWRPIVSVDGHSVVFQSETASGLTSVEDVFMRDLQSGAFALISASSNGTSALSTSEPMSISVDGTKVAFRLFPAGGTNFDVFVRDLISQRTIWASSNVSGLFPGTSYLCDQAVFNETGQYLTFIASTWGIIRPRLLRLDLESGELVQVTSIMLYGAWPAISSDARYIAFSDGTNVFRWDATTGSNVLVNVNTNGSASSSGRSYSPAMSLHGSEIVFLSDSTDLTAEDTHGKVQVFVRDMQNQTTVLASRTLDGTGVTAGDLSGIQPEISSDGTRTTFDTSDPNLVAGDYNQASDVFVYYLTNGAVELISACAPSLVSSTSVGVNGVSGKCLSDDGRFLLLKSQRAGLGPTDPNSVPGLVVRDLTTGSNMVVSATAFELGATNLGVTTSEISSDGRYVIFGQRYWPPGGVGPQEDVFQRDVLTGTLALVSALTNGSPSGAAFSSSMSANGRWGVFQSVAAGLVTNAYGTGSNVFLRDMISQTTSLISITLAGNPTNGNSWAPRISQDGRWVAFLSLNRGLVSPRPPFNLVAETYVRDTLSNRTYLVSLDPVFVGLPDSTSDLQFTGDGLQIIFGTHGSNYRVYAHHLAAHTNQLVCDNCGSAAVTPDGRWVAFEQPASGGALRQLIRMDLLTGVTNFISVNSTGGLGNATSSSCVITPGGRYAIFSSLAWNLVASPSAAMGLPNLYARDMLRQTTMLLTPSLNGTSVCNATVGPPILAADGETVLFHTLASDLVRLDYNSDRDVFLLRISRGDSDGDGMDDDWELAYFGDLSRDGRGDYDLDGQTDLAEFLAGTNPTAYDSIFRALTVLSPGSSTTQILWNAVPGKNYQVQYKTNLTDSPWLNLPGTTTATGTTGVATDSGASQTKGRFYRVLLLE